MLQDQTKLNTLIQRARQKPEAISPAVLAKLNHHLKATNQPEISLPWAVPTEARQPFPPSPREDQDADNSIDKLKADYVAMVQKHAADPDSFSNEDHQKMVRLNCLISHANQAQRIEQEVAQP
jgi:hypothetical protein